LVRFMIWTCGEPLALEILEATGADPRLTATLEDSTPDPVMVTVAPPMWPVCAVHVSESGGFSPSTLTAIGGHRATLCPDDIAADVVGEGMSAAIIAESNLRRRFYR
jgi:hypothetical protein